MKSFRFAVGAMLLLAAASALACSTEDRIAMAQIGYTTVQIDAACLPGADPFMTPSIAAGSVCVTRYGSCGLATRVHAGNQCGCPLVSGWALGVAR